MSKQWVLVLAVIGGLVIGSALLVWYGPEVQPVAVGAKAPDFRVVDLASGDSVGLNAARPISGGLNRRWRPDWRRLAGQHCHRQSRQ